MTWTIVLLLVAVCLITVLLLKPRWKRDLATSKSQLGAVLSKLIIDNESKSDLDLAGATAKESGDIKTFYASLHIDLPASFDGSIVWKDYLLPTRSQGKCGNAWAFCAPLVLADRWCIWSLGKVRVVPSVTQVIACNVDLVSIPPDIYKYYGDVQVRLKVLKTLEEIIMKNACKGITIYEAARELYSIGYTSTECLPTEATSPAYNIMEGVIPACTTISNPDLDTCLDHSVAARHYRAQDIYKAAPDEYNIMYEIYKHGPVMSQMNAYEDWLHFKGKGIYTHADKTGGIVGIIALRVVGWGEEGGIKYWIASSPCCPTWGKGSFFKIKRMVHDLDLEENTVCVIPDIPDMPPIKHNGSFVSTGAQTARDKFGWKIDVRTGYVESAIPKIKKGTLKGDLTPIADIKPLGNLDDWFAAKIGRPDHKVALPHSGSIASDVL